MEMIMIFPILFCVAVVGAELASQKGYSGRWWLLISIILPIVSLFIVFLLKKKEFKPKFYPSLEDKKPADKVLFRKA